MSAPKYNLLTNKRQIMLILGDYGTLQAPKRNVIRPAVLSSCLVVHLAIDAVRWLGYNLRRINEYILMLHLLGATDIKNFLVGPAIMRHIALQYPRRVVQNYLQNSLVFEF